jgi:hypothetical protein
VGVWVCVALKRGTSPPLKSGTLHIHTHMWVCGCVAQTHTFIYFSFLHRHGRRLWRSQVRRFLAHRLGCSPSGFFPTIIFAGVHRHYACSLRTVTGTCWVVRRSWGPQLSSLHLFISLSPYLFISSSLHLFISSSLHFFICFPLLTANC